MCSNFKVRTEGRDQMSELGKKSSVGNRKNLDQIPFRTTRNLVLARSNGHPFWYSHPDGTIYDRLTKSCAAGPRRGEVWVTLIAAFTQSRPNSHHGEPPLVDRTTVCRPISPWVREYNQWNGDVAHTSWKYFGFSPWSNQTIVTPSIFGRQWI